MNKTVLLALLGTVAVGSFLMGTHWSSSTKKTANPSGRKVLYYVDPMHPAYKSDKPGIAPDCGMQLEAVYADEGSPVDSSAGDRTTASVSISPEQQQLIGVRVGMVERTSGMRTLRVLGRVAADETRVYRLSSGLDGYVLEAFHNSVGSLVKKDEPLANIAGPDLRSTQQSFLLSATRAPENRNEVLYQTDWRSESAKLSVDRLRALGMSDEQIKELAAKRQVADSLRLLSPVEGIVLARNVAPGQRFDKGTELYRIADLSHVWIVADFFENEVRYFQPGRVAKVTLPQQGRSFSARVSRVLPQFDPASRTMKLRLEAENSGYQLRPDMFVDVELSVPAPTGLSIPSEALLDSGITKRVFVERGSGYFEPREVTTGARFGNRVEITHGLRAGERIVVSGTFLLDSESKLRLAAGTATPEAGKHIEQSSQGLSGGMDHHDASAGSVRDPTCGMKVDPNKAETSGFTLQHGGTTYYFCSKQCRDNFQKDPDRYLASKDAGAGHD